MFVSGPVWVVTGPGPVFCSYPCKIDLIVLEDDEFATSALNGSAPSIAIERLHCGSRSTSSTFFFLAARASAKFHVKVVFPTPPLLLKILMNLVMKPCFAIEG